MQSFKRQTERILAEIDVRIGGSRPWDVRIHDERVYRRALTRGSVGVGEAYMDGWWDCDRLDEFFFRAVRARLHRKYRMTGQEAFHWLSNALFNRQSLTGAREVIRRHYDLGNDLFTAMLDKRMTYTCAFWTVPYPEASGPGMAVGGPRTLDEAQEAKLELVCRKLGLKAGERVLDIGCGFGSFAKYAAENYGVHVTGITISREQLALGTEMTRGLSVELKFQDYRHVDGKFDKIASIGMFEAVGRKNFRIFMEIAARNLTDDGMFLLHTIGGSFSNIHCDPWTEKYIFPNYVLPTIADISKAIDGLFVVEDWQNLGVNYDRTLLEWHKNFEAHWPALREKYGERFRRMWNFFLLSSAATFRARDNQLWQIVLTKGGMPGGYRFRG